jgi:hypothetical protein
MMEDVEELQHVLVFELLQHLDLPEGRHVDSLLQCV